jgi:mannose-6-phosphate isomerase-like protein (cupin superfamily)
MKFTQQHALPFENPNIKGVAFNTHREFPDMSAEILHVNGWHGMVKSLNSTRCFHILDGSGLFLVAGKEIPVIAGDVVFVPHNTPHDFNGAMKLFLVHSPAYRKELVVQLE